MHRGDDNSSNPRLGRGNLFLFSIAGVILTGSFFVWQGLRAGPNIDIPQGAAVAVSGQENTKEEFSFELLSDPKTYANLPVGRLNAYQEEGAKGTAVVLLQSHQEPGTEVSDPTNDDAVVVQNEIFSIFNYLYQTFGLKNLMMEGEVAGDVNTKKTEKIGQLISLRESFVKEIYNLKDTIGNGVGAAGLAEFLNAADAYVASLDREVILAGAGEKLSALEPEVKIFGAENAATLDAGAKIVRAYIYQKDRLKQLDTRQQLSSKPTPLNQVYKNQIYNLMLSGRKQETNLPRSFSGLESMVAALGNTEAEASVDSLREIYNKIQALHQDPAKRSSAVPALAPARADNPYRSVNDPRELKAMMAETEQQIEKVVIEERNIDTARNFSEMLAQTGGSVGMLQFGAGHEEGLIRALRAQGLNVVAIVPSAVDSR